MQAFLIKQKKMEISDLVDQKKIIEDRLSQVNQEVEGFYQALHSGEVVNAHVFSHPIHFLEIDQLEKKISWLEDQLYQKKLEYKLIFKKEEIIKEIDKKRKDEFEQMVEKKQERMQGDD